jgi:hypothetical protein
MIRRRTTMFLAALLLVGCGDTTGPGTGTHFNITVTPGTRPQYSWAEGFALSLAVTRVSAPGTPVWGVVDPNGTLGSPVTHGTVPRDALEAGEVERVLTAGVQYRVTVTKPDGNIGFRDFTP